MASEGWKATSVREYARPGAGETNKRLAITFDDAYASVLESALPILAGHQFSATVLAITDYVGKENRWDVNLFWRRFRHLSWSELQFLQAQGWEIGSHSCSHAHLPRLSDSKLWHEVRDSRTELEQRLAVAIETFCLPYGRADARVLEAVQKAGYTTVLMLGQRVAFDGALNMLERRAVYLFDTAGAFHRKISAPTDDAWQAYRQTIISRFALGSALVKHLSGGSARSDNHPTYKNIAQKP